MRDSDGRAGAGRALARLLLGLSLALPPGLAVAGSAADTVEAFYLPKVRDVTNPAMRSRFVDPARAQLDRDARDKKKGGTGCIQWEVAADAQTGDFDQKTIKRTLKLEEKVNGNKARVTARFEVFPEGNDRSEIIWTLSRVGGTWKIADIASVASDWRLSELPCR